MNNCFAGKFQGMTVLVTGHTGFKGSWLSIWLRELGAKVVGYSLAPPTTPSNFSLCGLENKIIHIEGDVCDQDKLAATIAQYQPELVLHLAAQPIVLESYRNPMLTYQTNVMGTASVLEVIRRSTCVKAFVGVTSDKVYKDQGWYWGYREGDALGGFDPYSTSKAMTELVIASYRDSWPQSWKDGSKVTSFSQSPVSIASARAGNVIGGGDFADFRILPDFMKASVAGNQMVMRNPDSIRPWQHVMEPLSGYLWLAVKLLQHPDTYNEAWNFGPQEREPITCETLIAKAAHFWGDPCSGYRVEQQQHAAHEMHVLRVNWDLAAYRLNWAPAYGWEEAVKETVVWWKKYQAKCLEGTSVDMYDVCVDHIKEYVLKAQQKNISWAIREQSQ